jgi:hypothetical protein
MAATYQPLTVPRVDRTADAALRNVARDEGRGRLMVSIEERVGERLIEAFLRIYGAHFTGR